jgi:hypothetical protein
MFLYIDQKSDTAAMIVNKILCSVLVVLFIFSAKAIYANEINAEIKGTIYFYNPETNINNFTSLKGSFDSYLSKFSHYLFQPFNDKAIFEKSIAQKNKGIYLLSSWHFQYLPSNIHLKPIMVGVSNGQSTQKKILAVRHSIDNISLLKGKIIASSGGEQYTRNLLREMFGKDNLKILSTIKLLLVPKDIDALMAIGFGMATAALSSEKSLENLKNINLKQYKLLKPLLESQQYYLTLAAIPLSSNENNAGLLDILEKMGINPAGEIRLRMLGLDGWRRLSGEEQLLINQKDIRDYD